MTTEEKLKELDAAERYLTDAIVMLFKAGEHFDVAVESSKKDKFFDLRLSIGYTIARIKELATQNRNEANKHVESEKADNA